MQVVDEPIETLHIYVVPEKKGGKQPYTLLPLFAAFLCMAGIIGVTVYSALNPVYETLKIPAHFFAGEFKSTQTIVPTGFRTYPATTAHGTLTLTNGSVIAQQFPAGMIFTGEDGVEVVTDSAVWVPAGSANGYGTAAVSAHPMVSGRAGDIAALDINSVEGGSIYIRNVRAFTGGQDAYSVKFATSQDRRTALSAARAFLATLEARTSAILSQPCKETVTAQTALISVVWACRFIAYPHLPGYRITGMKIEGRTLWVTVVFVVRPRSFMVK